MPSFDLRKLFLDVFNPTKGDRVLFLVDLPTMACPDSKEWQERRKMAIRWQNKLNKLAPELGINMLPMTYYNATGANNAPLPSKVTVEGKTATLKEIVAETTLCIAMTQYSASAPLIVFTKEFPTLRVASMPGVAPRMEETALAADYERIYERTHILAEKLSVAQYARVLWSTDQTFLVDLRFRKAEADDGRLHPNLPPEHPRLINLPSGEAYSAPYEGEREGELSKTSGQIPVLIKEELIGFIVKENRIVAIEGNGSEAKRYRRYFKEQCPICGNIAELGLGCNERAVRWGNILEDEKVLGLHWAYGRSEHLGGCIGPEKFPEGMVTHEDIVYAKTKDRNIPYVAELVLISQDGKEELILHDGQYVLEEPCFQTLGKKKRR
ncbi:MAG: hypothetical protein ACFFCQ_17990, partial [Promethearchaeota archaeon]